MKKLLLFTFGLITYFGYAQCADPIITNFECGTPSHPITGALVSIANPVPGGINPSSNVGEYTDNNMMGFDNLTVEYGTAIDLSTNYLLKIKFYSPISVQILAKLEGGTNTPDKYSPFSAVNTWQEFTFDFSAEAADGNTRVVLFFNPGFDAGTGTDIFYIDDLRFDAPPAPCVDPVITNFECSAPSHPITGALVTIPNPAQTGINTSLNVGQYTDNNTDGFDALTVQYPTAIDLSTNSLLKIKFYSPISVQILAKLEGGTNTPDKYSPFSAVNTWQEFTFDFTAEATDGNTRVVLFFNPGFTGGTGTDTYLIDDLRFDNSTLSIADFSKDSPIKVYPNPASHELNLSSIKGIENYEIYNVLGKTVKTSSKTITNTIFIDNLKSGIYFLKLNTSTSSQVIKFVKH